MAREVETILQSTRDRLRELGEALENLVQSYPDVFEAPEIAAQLESFRQAHREATDRLDKPTLAIATLGTTSSGKSTIVNALIGRRIAPMEAGEMSGGVLTLRHADERKLAVEATEGAGWETGEWTDLSDEAIYDRIRNSVMFPYHEIRGKQKECIAPEVIAYGPLLAVSNPNLIGLPPGVGVELIDLPGLKSVQDGANLKVIQARVHKAFSLVALDYMQVDDEHRKLLLEELKQVVKYLQGRTDSMIFILNRVDQRGAEDIPIEERIGKLKTEIQEVLSLKEPPDIIPFNARLLYNAQCAWGAGKFDSDSGVEQEKRLKLLQAMIEDCSKSIRQHTQDDREVRDWFRKVEDRVCAKKPVSDKAMRQILRYALKWSGGARLWKRLRERVRESFPELILLPALLNVFKSYDALAAAIDSVAAIRKISIKEEVEAEQEKIRNSREQLRNKSETLLKKRNSEVKNIIEALKADRGAAGSRIAQEAQEKKRQGWQKIIDAIDAIEEDVLSNIIIPVRTTLKEETGAFALEDKLKDFIPATLAKDIASAYDEIRGKLDGFTEESGCLTKRVRDDDADEKQKLENAERAVRQLYKAMRDALPSRAEFTLQGQAKQIQEALQGLGEEAAQELCELVRQELPSFKLDEAVIAYFKKKLFQELPALPEKLFELSDNIKVQQSTEQKVVGKKAVTETYTEKFFFFFKKTKTRTKYENVYEDVHYQELTLPNADTMAEDWFLVFKEKEENLWEILCWWIVDYLKWVKKEFKNSVDFALKLAEDTLQDQLRIIEQTSKSEIARWGEVEERKALVTIARQHLQNESLTKKVS